MGHRLDDVSRDVATRILSLMLSLLLLISKIVKYSLVASIWYRGEEVGIAGESLLNSEVFSLELVGCTGKVCARSISSMDLDGLGAVAARELVFSSAEEELRREDLGVVRGTVEVMMGVLPVRVLFRGGCLQLIDLKCVVGNSFF